MARKLIGPKVQAAVPDQAAVYIERRARQRKVKEAVVVRELILAGIAAVADRPGDEQLSLVEV